MPSNMWNPRSKAILGLCIGAAIPPAIVFLLPPYEALFAYLTLLVTGVLMKDSKRNWPPTPSPSRPGFPVVRCR